MRALVTGGVGFIGSHLVEELQGQGWQVAVMDRSLRRPRRSAASGPAEAHHALDVRDPGAAAVLDEGRFDAIFHLAGSGQVSDGVHAPLDDVNDSLMSAVHLLDWARARESNARLIFASTASVYGTPERLPIREADRTAPISTYGVSKLAVEQYAAVFAATYGVRTAALRFFSLYGPRQRKLVVYDLLKKFAAPGEPPVIFGDGTQLRDFCYVKDAVRAARIVCERGAFTGEAYNIATGAGVAIRQLAERARDIAAPGRAYSFTGAVRAGDAQAWVADISRVGELGFAPEWTIEDGLRATAEWFFAEGQHR